MWRMHDRNGEEVTIESCSSLIESIKRHGQKHPVLGRRVQGRDGYEIELVYGARRLFVAQQLGRDLLIELTELDDRAALIAMDIENRVREDISPYERGRSYKRWLTAGYFKSQVEIAKELRISEAQVSRLLSYAELPAVVVSAFASPKDIREEWAVTLARRCREPECRDRMLPRARNLAKKRTQRASAQSIFDELVHVDADTKPIAARARHEVIRGADGKPLFRIAFRARDVHVIIGRNRVVPEVCETLVREIRAVLENGVSEVTAALQSAFKSPSRRGQAVSEASESQERFSDDADDHAANDRVKQKSRAEVRLGSRLV
ncbi:ParB/RepB/Spo0J family partition protein [Steroidobacter cummioxidans]|uniref:ParB/RepB/Spo0J family partition protein n=1 Tax=Steroidobacter cummioxidans TaxID=1803913 RepID=UPI0023AF62C2|nr:ParB/RepB/Spo0J family partition protein [Steroidobacter cummioxidans]